MWYKIWSCEPQSVLGNFSQGRIPKRILRHHKTWIWQNQCCCKFAIYGNSRPTDTKSKTSKLHFVTKVWFVVSLGRFKTKTKQRGYNFIFQAKYSQIFHALFANMFSWPRKSLTIWANSLKAYAKKSINLKWIKK